MICFDANSKLGEQHISGDPHEITENGKILEGIIERHALSVANGIKEKRKGLITRARTTKDGEEKSVIDLVLMSEDMMEHFKEIVIDEEKNFALENIRRTKKGIDIKKSDHNTIISKFIFR